MPRKAKVQQLDALQIIVQSGKKKKQPVVHSTRGTDADGRDVDYIRHEECAGKGCARCKGFGFTKQYVVV
jgi:hypothetical protein